MSSTVAFRYPGRIVGEERQSQQAFGVTLSRWPQVDAVCRSRRAYGSESEAGAKDLAMRGTQGKTAGWMMAMIDKKVASGHAV
jgi:hypothetical protein